MWIPTFEAISRKQHAQIKYLHFMVYYTSHIQDKILSILIIDTIHLNEILLASF
jgi:hypothetical protein